MCLCTIHTLITVRACAAQRVKNGAVAQIPGLITALPNAAALPKKFTKIFDLRANFARGPAVNTEPIVTDAITGETNKESGGGVLIKQKVVVVG